MHAQLEYDGQARRACVSNAVRSGREAAMRANFKSFPTEDDKQICVVKRALDIDPSARSRVTQL
eukprot:CAMPEP_0183346988 /NCGR_PEP_ID=MMETSP0164_2-20130417/11948_1 /TAXON_ID=221442 /ORGANISM="Coccolithus pelagicus ssp braarudi, Strain PLY182g" /LENGTH=63 /DNA_ID=CAMNT_0025518353 /DNA_START=768 /DNA_END=959 /DNA_ORIENTATION=+